jgi:hypothetical protein
MMSVERDLPPSKWLRVPLSGLAGLIAVAIATAALHLMGLGTSNGVWSGAAGGITILGVWHFTRSASMVRPVALGIVAAIALGAVAVAIQIAG